MSQDPASDGSASGAAPGASRATPARAGAGWRAWAAALAFALGAGLLAWSAHAHYPVQTWLVWPWALAWTMAAVWGYACLAGGWVVLGRLGLPDLRPAERLLFAYVVGALLFALGIFLAGVLHALGPILFVAWPLAMAAVGTRPLMRFVFRWQRRARSRSSAWPSPWTLAATMFGLVGVAAVAFALLTPDNAAYDARWYHLGLAEHYAAAGRIAGFPEARFNAGFPKLATWLYTWAFLLPGATLFERVELAAHMELVVFVATLAGVGLLVARLVPGRRARGAWATLFLFPGVWLYDSSLSLGADHVLALWAPPIALLLLSGRRPIERLRDLDRSLMLGLVMGAAAMVKYQAVTLLALPAAALAAAAMGFWFEPGGWRPRPSRASLRGPMVTTLTALVVTAPQWLSNWVWYHDPVFPLAHDLFHARPWVDGVPLSIVDAGWTPDGPLVDRVLETARATVTYAFKAHDWGPFHGDRPVFGYLGLLTLIALPFVRARRRVFVLAAGTLVGVALWYWTYHQDRYLQALVPWMAATTAATLVLGHRLLRGWWRAPLYLLVAMQILDGADVYFIPGHAMTGEAAPRRTMDVISAGWKRHGEGRDSFQQDLVNVGAATPSGATVLLHAQHMQLGLGRPSVTDTWGQQAGIVYPRLLAPNEIVRTLADKGVTHVVYRGPGNFQRLSDDLVFYDFATRFLKTERTIAGFQIAPLPITVPAEPRDDSVVIVACRAVTTTLDRLGRDLDDARAGCSSGPPPPLDERQRLARFFVVDHRVSGDALGGVAPKPVRLFDRDQLTAWSRPPRETGPRAKAPNALDGAP